MFYRQGKIKVSTVVLLVMLILEVCLAGCGLGIDGEEERRVEETPAPTVAVTTTKVSVTAEATDVIEPTRDIAGEAAAFPDQTGTLWAPYLEWSVENDSFTGNPYDVVATVSFIHGSSGESRSTEMFYAGDNVWKFRFSGTRTGQWTFITSSDDPELNGRSGTATINPNPNPDVRGFITSVGNKFARQVGENGELEAYLFNVFQDDIAFPSNYWDRVNNRSLDYIRTYPAEEWARQYLQAARDHGSNTLFISLANQWFQAGARRYDEHESVNPELLTFEMLERVIRTAHEQGGHVHIWMWGDEARKWTPAGLPGGINGEVDRRLQRYIAARLGPLPGWTMSYGFDLGERGWIEGDTARLDAWAQYLHQHMGWRHLLFTRGYAPAQVDGVSYSSNGPGSRAGAIQTSANGPASYAEVLEDINGDLNRPHLYEERFYYMRKFAGGPPWTMEKTRRVLWWNAMAGGVGSHWGYHYSLSERPYPNPEQMATHYQFWTDRFLLDMAPAGGLSDGYVLKNQANSHFVFYKESSSAIQMNLEGMAGSQPAVAVDTKLAYDEIDLGVLGASNQSWTAPYESDWAIAVGEFPSESAP